MDPFLPLSRVGHSSHRNSALEIGTWYKIWSSEVYNTSGHSLTSEQPRPKRGKWNWTGFEKTRAQQRVSFEPCRTFSDGPTTCALAKLNKAGVGSMNKKGLGIHILLALLPDLPWCDQAVAVPGVLPLPSRVDCVSANHEVKVEPVTERKKECRQEK